MENHGLESAIPTDFSDARLPENLDDSAWNTSESSTTQPKAYGGFTDMTLALIQYESSALIRVVLTHSLPLTGHEKGYCVFHSQMRQKTWQKLEQRYLKGLDLQDLRQSLAMDIANLTFKRMHLTQLRPLIRTKVPDQATSKELEFK